MLPEIKLTVTQNDKLIQTVTKTIENQQNMVKSLEIFQVEANAALTRMIEGLGETGNGVGDADLDEDDDNDDTEDDNAEGSHSTSLETKVHSKSKRKKHH